MDGGCKHDTVDLWLLTILHDLALAIHRPVPKFCNHFVPNCTVGKKSHMNKMPVSCCAVVCTNCFRNGAGVLYLVVYVSTVDQHRKEMWVQAISRVGASELGAVNP